MRVASCGMRVGSCGLRVAGCEFRDASCALRDHEVKSIAQRARRRETEMESDE